MRTVLALSLTSLVLAGSGCATAFKSKKAEITVTSTTPGADVLINGNKVGVTPARLAVSHKHDHTITVRGAAGEQTCTLRSGVSAGWVVLDLVTGGGWLIDLLTKNWNSLDRTECTVAI